MKRLLARAGLARAADVDRERRSVGSVRAAERARASQQAAHFSAKLERLQDKLRAAHTRLAAEHADTNTLRGLLRHYLIRLKRTERELVEGSTAQRRLKRAQISMAVRRARRRPVSRRAAARAAHLASVSSAYIAAVPRWRAGDVPSDVRRVRLARLHWSIPANCIDSASQQILSRELPFDDLATVRQFAVGRIMLDIGAHVGATSIPRLVLGDFSHAYAAEPEADSYLCLVGNTLDNNLEGRLLPDRIAISGPAAHGRPIEEIPTLLLDEWVERLGIATGDVHFVRMSLREWNLDVLLGATNLLARRHIVWQVEIRPSLVAARGAAIDGLSGQITAHFTHIKELGRFWTDQWRVASDVRTVLETLANDGRGANLLLFNLPMGTRHKRSNVSLVQAAARLPKTPD